MNILFVITKSAEIGGAQIHIRDLSIQLKNDGHNVSVISGESGDLTEFLIENGVDVYRISELKRSIHLINDLKAVYGLIKYISILKPDLVSLHSSKAGVVGRLACFIKNTKVIFTAHGWAFADGIPEIKRKTYIIIEKLLAKITCKIITVSKQDEALALKYKVCEPNKIVTIHNGMINSLQKQPKKTVPLIKLVMVARFSAQKDHNLLFQALSMINNKNWSLDLIGGGEDSDKVGLLLKQYKIEKHVNLIGQINNVDEVLYEYDIFLLISKWEGFPRSILEAMRTGLPVIASDVGGVNESVIDSKGGFLVPRGDVTSLIQCLQKLMGCSKLRSTMGEFNRSRFVEEFTFEAMYQKNINLYNEVLLSCKKF